MDVEPRRHAHATCQFIAHGISVSSKQREANRCDEPKPEAATGTGTPTVACDGGGGRGGEGPAGVAEGGRGEVVGDELVGAAAVAQPVQPHHEATGPRGGRALVLHLSESELGDGDDDAALELEGSDREEMMVNLVSVRPPPRKATS